MRLEVKNIWDQTGAGIYHIRITVPTLVIHFDNPAGKPVTFVAYCLLNKDDHELIAILPGENI